MREGSKAELREKLKTLIGDYDRIAQEIKGRKRRSGMDFFVPNPVQFRALKSKAQIVALVLGNRSGKTEVGAFITACHITKRYPDYFPVSKRFKPGQSLKIRVATDNFSKIDSVIEPKLRSHLPVEELVRIRRSPQGYINKLHTKDGTMVEFLTMEQDPMAFEGQDLDFFWGDEPQDRQRYVATQRGLMDRHGQTLLTFTPLVEPWMKEEICDVADGKKIEVFTGSTRENLADINGNPILSEEDIAAFESMLTPEEREARIQGHFFHLRGVVYKEFCEHHLLGDFNYEKGYPTICVLDPHDRLPHHVIWAMIDRINDIIVMYEDVFKGTTRELAARIKTIEKHFGWSLAKRLIDPNFGRSPSRSTGITMIEELYKCGLSFTEANDDKAAGHLSVKDYLHFNREKPITMTNKPKLWFVKDMCPVTIRSMRNLQHAEWKSDKDRDPKEDVKQKDTHGADCVRYLVLSKPEFEPRHSYQGAYEGAYA